MILKSKVLLASATMAIIALAPNAVAHSDLKRTLPEVGTVRDEVPDHVLIQFTQRPQKNARVTVLDGCRNSVVRTLQLQKDTAHIEIQAAAQPGRFKVSYRVVSAIDGDSSRGSYGFRVRGSPDCSEPTPAGDAEESANSVAQGGDGPRESGETSNTTILLLGAVGTVALVGIGLLLRRGQTAT